jgi:hypothetical protein
MLVACLSLQLVMREFPEARLAYGESDEYSFVLHKDTNLYGKWGHRQPMPNNTWALGHCFWSLHQSATAVAAGRQGCM